MSQQTRSWKTKGQWPTFARLDDDELLRLSREQPEAFGPFYERHVRAVLAHLRRKPWTPRVRGGEALRT